MNGPVLNIRDLRRIGTWAPEIRRIDRRSPYGNPFRIGSQPCGHPDCVDHVYTTTREQALRAYRSWLVGMLKVEPAFLDELRGHPLACWCAPLACHGDVILEALDAPSIAAWLEAA